MIEPNFDIEPEPELQTEKDLLKSFAGWKFDLADAISMDPRITGSEFRVAYRLLQHANSKTGAIYPSQQTIADQIGCRPRQVSQHIKSLIKKGWLHKYRKNRQSTNSYRFDTKHINEVLDIQTSRKEWRAEQRQKRLADMRDCNPQKSLTGP